MDGTSRHRTWQWIGAALAGFLAITALLTAEPASAGEVRFMRDARTEFTPYLTNSGTKARSWMRRNYWRMRGYVPFFTQHAVDWAPPTQFYKDSYAIYNDRYNRPGRPDLDTLEDHPDWVLRDSAGRRLYIDFACSNGSCPQFAADLGNKEFRTWWIQQARVQFEDGYRGLYIDDVNLDWRISNGNGDTVIPQDPRTGKPMTLTAWRGYFATFLEEVRAAFPGKEITHNALWWTEHSDPRVRRQVAAADFVQLERGFNDAGIVKGHGKFGYVTFLRHIRWLHRRGASVILKPYDLNRRKAEYELASHLLTRSNRDALMSDYKANPGRFWRGWKLNLGRPRGGWYRWKGLFRRNYSKGVALVNQPGSKRRRVRVPGKGKMKTIAGKRVRKVRLGPATGKVLRRR